MNIVKLHQPEPDKEVVEVLKTVLARAKAGEFDAIFICAFTSSGSWITTQRGKRLDLLRTIGVLESLKMDLLNSATVLEGSGL